MLREYDDIPNTDPLGPYIHESSTLHVKKVATYDERQSEIESRGTE